MTGLFLALAMALGPGGEAQPFPVVLQESPEATVWFLGSSGWAVRVQESLLIFDYHKNYGPGSEEDPRRHGVADGFINPEEVAGLDVYVFVTHEHADHFDEVIFSWQEEVESLTYFMGWAQDPVPHCQAFVDGPARCHTLAGPRASATAGPVSVHTVNSHHSGVPEVAYLVRFGDWVFYHGGDYKADFLNDYPYLSGFEESIDAAFLGAEPDRTDQYFRQAEYLIGLFDVPTVFGGHFGQDLWRCHRFAEFLVETEAGSETVVHCPEAPGQRFDLRK